MGKHKHSSTATVSAPTSSAGSEVAWRPGDSLVQAHDAFFQRIIGMIPRELYKPVEEEDDVNVKYYKHKKQALPSEVKKSIRCAGLSVRVVPVCATRASCMVKFLVLCPATMC